MLYISYKTCCALHKNISLFFDVIGNLYFIVAEIDLFNFNKNIKEGNERMIHKYRLYLHLIFEKLDNKMSISFQNNDIAIYA